MLVAAAFGCMQVEGGEHLGQSTSALTLSDNLSLAGGSDGSSKASGSSFGKVRDGDLSSFWAPRSSTNERISVKWRGGGGATFNTAIIRELGSVVSAWRLVDADTGSQLAAGSTIGSELVVRFGEVSAEKLSLFIDRASSAPRIAEFEVYRATGDTELEEPEPEEDVVQAEPDAREPEEEEEDEDEVDTTPSVDVDLGSAGLRGARPEGFGESVTGGAGGAVVVARTGTEIHRAICERSADDTPLTVLVDGTITPGNTTKQRGSCNTKDGVIELKEISNVSLIGVGRSGLLDQVGVHLRSSSNIIVQNITIRNVRKSNTSTPSNGGDAIGMEANVSRVWIDHNLIHGSTIEGEEHDGLIDMKNGTRDVTVSFNHLHTGGRGGLVGSNDKGNDGSTRITWHHNFYENLNSRTHLVREARGHAYNNYYSGIRSTGINVRNGASLLIEGNFFEDSRNPVGTFFFLDNPGIYELNDNIFSNVVFDAGDRERPAAPGVSTGSVSVPYDYRLDSASRTPAIVRANAGVGRL